MNELLGKEELISHMPPAELVAPTLAYLCHEECGVNGLYIEAPPE